MYKNIEQSLIEYYDFRYERYAGEPKNVTELHRRALKALKPELLDNFSSLYNFFSNGVV